MSEQFAMQPDEFDSTNERLDSILDRLNALGASAAEMKIAPLRPLQSVPDLDPAVADAAPDLPVMSTPALPQLDLVPPAAPNVEISPVTDSPAVAEQPEPVIETTVPSVPVAEAPAVAVDTPVESPAIPESHAVSAPVPDMADPAWPVVEATSVDGGPATPVDDAPSWPVVEPVGPVEPVASAEPTSIEPQSVEPGPVEVEYHDLDFETPDATEDLADSILEIMEAEEPPLVFDLEADNMVEHSVFDTPVQENNTAVDTPDAPTSIFASSLSTPSPDTASPTPDSDESDGWVSYHDSVSDEPPTTSPDLFEAPEFANADADAAVNDAPDLVEEPLDDFFAASPPDAPVEAEPAVAVPDGAHDVFSAMAESDEPITIAGIDNPLVDIDPAELYDSDEELPLPDFTGVYAESIEEDGFWGETEAVVPDPVETGLSPMSIARDELDKLRPHEEEIIVEETSSASRTVKLQFLMVLMFGLIVLAFVLGDDPQVIDDMRESISNLLG